MTDLHLNGDHNKLFQHIGELQGKMDSMLDKTERFFNLYDTQQLKIESLQKEVARAKGWAVGAGAVTGMVITFAKELLFRK